MNRWDFTIKELKALNQERQDTQVICQAYVEWVLLKGYTIHRPRVISGDTDNT
jgi:hypothetical protein